ncbi:MAG: hypothetical protein R3230_01545 [Nitrosopumilaceae archaeon]|nr:hypothetical protein [Nitrosopumilaceae archaeon]
MNKPTLASLLPQLEELINEKMNEFASHGKKIKKINKEIAALKNKADELYSSMKSILDELDPVIPIVKDQNPQLIELFDALKESNE